MANISQQLRLLEASSLVGKRKIPNRDRGKPRTLFHLNKDFGYLIQVSDGFAQKRLLDLDGFQRALLTTFFLENKALHYLLQKWFWKIESSLQYIDAILIDEEANAGFSSKIALVIVTPKVDALKKKIGAMTLEDPKGSVVTVQAECLEQMSAKKRPMTILYDPRKIASKQYSQ